jgi:thioredoxin 2
MSALPTDAEGVLTRCPSCNRKNRIAWRHLAGRGRCGECKASLPAPREPIEISSDEAFAGLVRDAPAPVLVDFWAAWCGPCQMVAPELEKVAAGAAGRLFVAKVDTEALPGLSQAFRIASIPTLVLFVGGREEGRVMGARPAEGILQFVEEQLAHLPGKDR